MRRVAGISCAAFSAWTPLPIWQRFWPLCCPERRADFEAVSEGVSCAVPALDTLSPP